MKNLSSKLFFLRICRFLHCALPLVVKKHFLILSLLKQVVKGFVFVLRNLNAPDSFILRKYRLSQNHIPQLIKKIEKLLLLLPSHRKMQPGKAPVGRLVARIRKTSSAFSLDVFSTFLGTSAAEC